MVDDLHWADETTCDFLVYLASTAARRRLSMVHDATGRRDAARPPRRAGRLRTDPAAGDHLRGAAAARPGRNPRTGTALTGSDTVDVEAWYEQTQGNPYLLGELVKDPGSRRVKDVLLSRVRTLGTHAAELVRLAAVFGLSVADEQLFRASGFAPARYGSAVREAVEAGVLVVEGADYQQHPGALHGLVDVGVAAQDDPGRGAQQPLELPHRGAPGRLVPAASASRTARPSSSVEESGAVRGAGTRVMTDIGRAPSATVRNVSKSSEPAGCRNPLDDVFGAAGCTYVGLRRPSRDVRRAATGQVVPGSGLDTSRIRPGGIVSDHVYRLTEVVGSSETSVAEAIRTAVQKASQTVRNIEWFEAKEIRGQVVDGDVAYFQVTVKLGFRVD